LAAKVGIARIPNALPGAARAAAASPPAALAEKTARVT
jgi:hypothetical protein